MMKTSLNLAIGFVLLVGAQTALAQARAERITILTSAKKPLFGLQQIRTTDGVQSHVFKFNKNGSAYELRLSPESIIVGFSETTFILSPGFQLVVPSGTDLSQTPRLVATGKVDPTTPGGSNQTGKTSQTNQMKSLDVAAATDTDVKLIRNEPDFSTVMPVRYQVLKDAGTTRFVIQTSQQGDNIISRIFRVDGSKVKANSISATMIGFSETTFTLATGETLVIPFNTSAKASLSTPSAATLKPISNVQTTELEQVSATEELKVKIHSAQGKLSCEGSVGL